MAQTVSPHSDMAHARQSDGINVIFDERSPAVYRSRSSSRSSSNSSRHSSRRSRGRAHKGRYRSSSSSSSSSSTSRSTSRSSRSRSHPRCHRHSSRCCCSSIHRRYQRGHSRHSPHLRYQEHSRSHSRSPSVDRYYHRRRYRSRSRSSSYRARYSRVDGYRSQFSRSPPRSFRGKPKSRSSEHSIALSVEEKRQLLEAARQNAMKNLGVQKLELPESVKPILMLPSAVSERGFAGPETRVRRDSENASQSTEVENDGQSPRLSPKRGISFSSNNSVAKPTVSTQPCARVTSLVDSVESRKPYGHWIPVKSARR